MSTHINAANKNDIANTVLMPGDPLRAKFIAENFLEGAKCYNEIRGMYGYTGTYKGVPVSVQGSGMGMPSMGIYSWELYTEYDVENIIRIGTAGSFHDDIKVKDIVVALAASTDSNYIHAFDDFTKSSICAVQMRRVLVHNEELTTCGVGHHASCHGKNTFGMF